MKLNYYFNMSAKLITTLFFSVLATSQISAQCIMPTSYGNATLDNTSTPSVQIDMCNYAGDVADLTINDVGQYEFTSTIAGDYLTVTDGSNVVIDHGTAPLTVNIPSAGTYRLHIAADAGCTQDQNCRETRGEFLSPPSSGCISSTHYGNRSLSNTTTPAVIIAGCNYAGEYSVLTINDTGQYEFTSSNNNDYLTITDNSNNILSFGPTPLTVSIPSTGFYRLHVSADIYCTADNSCRTTTGEYTGPSGCISTTQYGSATLDNTSTPAVTVDPCYFAGEYGTLTINDTGQYEFTSSDPGDYLTLTDGSNNIIDHGTTPLTLSITSTSTYRLHVAADANCATENSCRALTGEYTGPTGCIVTTSYVTSTLDNSSTPAITIDGCYFAGEYGTLNINDTGQYEFTSSDPGDYLTLTDASNNILYYGTTPLSVSITAPGTYRLHVAANSSCATENVCRAITGEYTGPVGCISATPYLTATLDDSSTPPIMIDNCFHAGEYAALTINTTGQYEFTSSNTGDYLTLTDGSNNILDHGTTPFTVSIGATGTYRLHVAANAGCATESVCRAITGEYKEPSGCIMTTQFGTATLDSTNTSALTIDGCMFAGEYAVLTINDTGMYEFGSAIAGDYLTLSDTFDNIIDHGSAPFTAMINTTGTYRLHIAANAGCATENVCRAVTGEYIPPSGCIMTTQYGNETLDASSSPAVNIDPCLYAGEYAWLAINDSGYYEFTSSNSGDYLTLSDASNNIIDHGSSPLSVTIPSTGIFYLHVAADVSCATESTCRSLYGEFKGVPQPCSAPSNLTALNITTTDADLDWTENNSATNWEIEWGTQGFTQGNGTTLMTGTKPYSLSGLNAGTDYDFYVRSVCAAGDTSSFAGPFTFTTDSACSVGPSVTASITNDITCADVADGQVSTTVTGGQAPYSYNWSNNATSSGLSNVSGGTYSLTVTDNLGCTAVETVSLYNPDTLEASGTANNVSCFGGSDGSIQLNVTGGTTPYSYNWNQGLSGQNPTGLSAGTYNVTVSDAHSCQVMLSFTVNEPANALTASISSSTNVSCNGADDGTAAVTASGGTPGYSYAWSNSQTGNTATGLGSGIHTVTVTDAAGCTQNVNANISEPLPMNASMNTQHISCFGADDGKLTASVSGGTTPYSYFWFNGETAQTLDSLPAGTYSVTASDDNGCMDVLSGTINEPAELTSTINSSEDVSCFGSSDGSALVDANGGTTPYTYAWSNNETGAQAVNLGAGTHSVTVTDDNGCTSVSNVTIQEPDEFTADIAEADVVHVSCYGLTDGSAKVTVQGGSAPYSYNWTNGASGTEVSDLPAGNYEVTVTDDEGCSAFANAVIEEPAPIDTAVTRQGSELAADLQGAGYQWFDCDAQALVSGAQSRTFTPEENGTYAVIITYDGCVDTSSCKQVTNVGAGEITEKSFDFEVYPNPNNGLFNVRLTGHSSDAVQLQLLDVQGKLITERNLGRLEGESVEQLQMNIAAGMYFVKVVRDGELSVKRVVVR